MELMIPTPNWKFLDVALTYGADAVYIPVQGLVTISYQGIIFRREEIKSAIELVHRRGKKAYIVFNARLPEHQYGDVFKAIRETIHHQPDGVVLGDYYIMSWVADNFTDGRLEIIASITAGIQSGRDARFAFFMGADRIILNWLGIKKLETFKIDPKLGIDIFLDNVNAINNFPFDELVCAHAVKGIKIILPNDLKNAVEIIRRVRDRIDKVKLMNQLAGEQVNQLKSNFELVNR